MFSGFTFFAKNSHSTVITHSLYQLGRGNDIRFMLTKVTKVRIEPWCHHIILSSEV